MRDRRACASPGITARTDEAPKAHRSAFVLTAKQARGGRRMSHANPVWPGNPNGVTLKIILLTSPETAAAVGVPEPLLVGGGTTPRLKFPPAVDTASSPAIIAPQPKQRRNGRKSMSRRSGQNGSIVVQSGFYRVRWRMDTKGQKERINMTAKVAPVVFDKEGKTNPRHLKFGAGQRRSSSNPAQTRSNTSTVLLSVK